MHAVPPHSAIFRRGNLLRETLFFTLGVARRSKQSAIEIGGDVERLKKFILYVKMYNILNTCNKASLFLTIK